MPGSSDAYDASKVADETAMRSGTLAAWTSAWLTDSGSVSADEVIRAVTAGDAAHRVRELFGSEHDQPMSAAVIDWRRRAQPVTVVLPVSGDLRGLPSNPHFRAAAIQAGCAVHGGGLGLVPERLEFAPSSAPPTIVWHAFEVGPAQSQFSSVAEAQYELSEAITASAAVLARAGVGITRTDAGDRAAQVRRSGDLLDLPPGYPGRAVSLISQAMRMRALLSLAGLDHGMAVDLAGTSLRAAELRSLAAATRQALLSGYNALAARAL